VLEAYLKLYAVWPDPEVKQRLTDIFLVFRDRIVQPSTGSLAETLQDDWAPSSLHESYGHDMEAAHLMLAAARVLGLEKDEKTLAVTRRLVDHALEVGFDWTRGGIYENEPSRKPGAIGPKTWWAQAESLLALLEMHRLYGSHTDRYWKAFELQWSAIKRDFRS